MLVQLAQETLIKVLIASKLKLRAAVAEQVLKAIGELVGEGEGEGRRETTTGRRTSLAGTAMAAAGTRTSTTELPGTRPGTAAPAAAGGAGVPAAPADALIGTKDAILALKTTKKGLSKVGGL